MALRGKDHLSGTTPPLGEGGSIRIHVQVDGAKDCGSKAEKVPVWVLRGVRRRLWV